MSEEIDKIVFDFGELPVADKEGIDIIDFSDQVMLAKNSHKRRLEVVLSRNEENIANFFRFNESFAFWRPYLDEEGIKDVGSHVQYNYLCGKGFYHFGDSKNKTVITFFRGSHLNFYSMDSHNLVHKSEVNFKYLPRKNLIKFDIIYDGKIELKLDTNGNYSMSTLKVGFLGHKPYMVGNLISEPEKTLYIDKYVPVRISAEL